MIYYCTIILFIDIVYHILIYILTNWSIQIKSFNTQFIAKKKYNYRMLYN